MWNFIVGPTEISVDTNLPMQIQPEIKKIQADLLYVALTRAMSELYVLGK